MLTKRPLLDTAADLKLFVEDDSRQAAETEAFRLNNALIVGETGAGKTSLLHKIRHNANSRQPRDHPMAILIDARLAEGPRELIDLIVSEAEASGWISPTETPAAPNDPFGAVTQIRRLRATPDANNMILLDDPNTEQTGALFGRLRDELWQLSVWFSVAVNPTVERAVLTRPPADAFFDVRVELAAFPPLLAVEMLKLRATRGTSVITPTVAMQPRTVLTSSDTSLHAAPRNNPARQFDLIEAADKAAGRVGGMLVTEIWNGGPVSASDEALQQSLGLSRARLTQLLTALEQSGILTSFRDPEARGMGRPRTMYDIARD
jgi:hypothetical protein